MTDEHEGISGNETVSDADDQCDWTHPDPICVRVVDAVVETLGIDTSEIDPLYEHVDPDSLNDLFRKSPSGHPRRDGYVEFQMEGHLVTISSDGEIEVRPVSD